MRSRIHATDERFYGVYEGIVTSFIKDDKEGRVKIKFPWYDDKTEFECRVRQLYAGNGFGAFFIPESQTEVLVAFIQGDMRFPVILGGLYNGKDKAPTSRGEKKDEKMIRTKAGHQIILDDTEDSEKIVIVDKSGNNTLVIDAKSDSITITAKTGKISLNAKAGIEMKSDAEIKVEAKADLNLKGATINLN